MQTILVLSGSHLKLSDTINSQDQLATIHKHLEISANNSGVSVVCKQLNHEDDFISTMQDASVKYAGIIINADSLGDYTDALGRAITGSGLPCIEVCMSNNHASSAPQSESTIAKACWGVIGGLGDQSYLLALDALIHWLKQKHS